MTASSGHNLSRAQWAERLNEMWDSIRENAVDGFLRLGQELSLAKEQLSHHGQWQLMVETDLKFKPDTARLFMRIGEWAENASNARVLPLLPPDYTTIDKITRLDDETLERLIDEGIICPSLKRNEISAILRRERVDADEARVLSLTPIIGKFRTLVLDPAWEYDWLSLAGRAKPGYAMQSAEQLRELDVAAWADEEVGCHLYCWTTNNFMAEACRLVAHWGFQHRTIITWIKPPPFGLGSYFRNSTEHCLFATRGDTTTRPAAASIPTHFEAERGEHSEKPECFYDIVRAASYPPYGEGNQREPRPDFINLFEEIEREIAREVVVEERTL
jgi:N6-adenosine-specific RNA methylase IME4